MALRLDINGLLNEFLNVFESELYTALSAWEIEVQSKVKHNFYSKYAKVNHELRRQSKGFVAYLKANKYVLADSYGTGSKMLDINPGLAEYRNSSSWNPDRTGKAIVGRHEGTYTDLFGRVRKTSGTFKGVNIEGKRVSKPIDGNDDYYISATSPSYAIQLAQQYLDKQWIPLAYKRTINRINFAKFLIES